MKIKNWIIYGTLLFIPVAYAITYGIADAFMLKQLFNRIAPSSPQAIENEKLFSEYWHMAQAAGQVIYLALLLIAVNWRYALYGGASFWLFHDIMVNDIALNQGPFYVGQSALSDQFFHIFAMPELVQGLTKVTIFLLSLYLIEKFLRHKIINK